MIGPHLRPEDRSPVAKRVGMKKNNAARSGHQLLYRFRFGAAELDESRLESRVDGLVVALEQKPLQVLVRSLLLPRALLSAPDDRVPTGAAPHRSNRGPTA